MKLWRKRSSSRGAIGGWWTEGGATGAVAVYQPKGAASLAASYTDLSGSGNDAAPGVAPSWGVATGWGLDAATVYLETVVAQSNWTWLVRFANVTAAAFIFGERSGPGTLDGPALLPIDGSNALSFRYGGIRALSAGSGVSSGVAGMAGNTGYLDGVSQGSGTMLGTAAGTRQVYIGCINQGGAATFHTDGNVLAFGVWDNVLSADEVAAVSTAMAAL